MGAMTMVPGSQPPRFAWSEVPAPRYRPDEVLVEVAAAGVNRADLLQARGGYPPPPGASEILGLECAGVIRAVGAEVSGWAVGEAVCALLAGGGYAQRVAVPAAQLLPVPAGMDLTAAAALPEAVCTVWSNLVLTAGLSAGQRLLVHGGASGIGTMAIQVGRLLGAQVLVTASSTAKLARCRELGAHTTIDYTTQDFVMAVGEATDGRGADVILDVVGGDYLARNISALADGGRLVVIGLLGGARAELDLAALMGKRAGVIGTQLRSRPATGPGSKAEVVAAVREQLWPAVVDGRIRPVVDRVVDVRQAEQAHTALYQGAVIGKVVLQLPTGDGTNGRGR